MSKKNKLQLPYDDLIKEHGERLQKEAIQALTPELNENEDKRILASITACVGLVGDGWGVFSNHNVTKERVLSWIEKQKEQKPAEWSEEDLQHKSWILECLADGKRTMPQYAEDFHAAYNWLKSLGPQLKQEWNKEDERQLNWFYNLLDYIGKEFPLTWGLNENGGKKWLKSLRPQSKQKWSKEDEEKIDDIIRIICDARELSKIAKIGEEEEDNSAFYDGLVLFLKSLRPSWKPSKEQMDALRVSSEYEPCLKNREHLKSLYNNLKSL